MDNVKQQIVDRLRQANNILVTVRTDPSIDLLSSCIGLALVLDKLDKHATAVFSGEVPSALEFLKPEETLETTPNSLRDFIIALDKSKADKLRYKVEDKVVRIFITPYKTSLSSADLEFSQGDFNIDVVVALGVHDQAELDAAITEHGRILHDATIISINNTPNGNLGSLNWQDISASSVSEMVTDLALNLNQQILDGQIATALLTGVVAETARFSNDKTTPKTMNIGGELMAAGANQQLVADQLRGETHDVPRGGESTNGSSADNGTLEIEHQETSELAEGKDQQPTPTPETDTSNDQPAEEPPAAELPEPEAETVEDSEPVHTTSREMLPLPSADNTSTGLDESLGGSFTGEFKDDETADDGHGYLIDQSAEIAAGASGSTADGPAMSATMSLPPVVPPVTPILTHDQPLISPVPDVASQSRDDTETLPPAPQPSPTAQESAFTPPTIPHMQPPQQTDTTPGNQTLEDIEESVHSPHVSTTNGAEGGGSDSELPAAEQSDTSRIDAARAQVEQALKTTSEAPKPLESIGSHPFPPLHDDTGPAPGAATPPSTPAQPTGEITVDGQGNILPAQPMAPTVPEDHAPSPAMDMPLPPFTAQQVPSDQSAPPGLPPAGPPPFMPMMNPPSGI